MTRDHERINQLLSEYLLGNLTVSDEMELWRYVDDSSFEMVIKEILSKKFEMETYPSTMDKEVIARILQDIYKSESQNHKRKRFHWQRYAAAAAIIIAAISFGFYSYFNQAVPNIQDIQSLNDDVQPGESRAVLKMGDGQQYILNNGQKGIVLSENEIKYRDGIQIVEIKGADKLSPSVQMLTLATPRGGTYQVTLPDGTDVWLNAETELKYPNKFDSDRRVVELSGEAYFDVAESQSQNRRVPFIVKTAAQTVEVLGTQFNLSAYVGDENVKTTLVEGRVTVATIGAPQNRSIALKPGQQSVYKSGDIAVGSVDVEPFIAWKEGYFHFRNTPFLDVIQQVARWYDIDVIFEGDMPMDTFSGKMSREVSLQNVLKFFEGSGVNFTVEDDRLIVN